MTQLEHQGGPPGLELCHARSTDTAGHSGSRASQSSPRGQELLRPPFSRQLCLKSSKPMVDSLEKSALPLGIQNCLNHWFLALMKSPAFLMVCVLDETRHKADVPHLSLGKGTMGMCLNTC